MRIDWTYPVPGADMPVEEGVSTLLQAVDGQGCSPARGVRVHAGTSDMRRMTRAIEQRLGSGDLLYVGFQRRAAFAGSAREYESLVERGVRVIAFAEPDPVPWALSERDGLRLIDVPPGERPLENQWILVQPGPSGVALVGYETSRMLPGRTPRPGCRRFTGFLTDDQHLLASLTDHLDRVAARESVRPLSESTVRAAAGAELVMVPTTGLANDVPHARARALAMRLADEVGADLLLFDRTAESQLTDPQADAMGEGAGTRLSQVDAGRLRREHLAEQIAEAAKANIFAYAWIPAHPGPWGMLEPIERLRPDVVVLPEEMELPSLVDEIHGNTLEAFRDAIPCRIFLARADGRLDPDPPHQHAETTTRTN